MSLGFIIILGIVLVVFYLFIRKIFSEEKIVNEDTAEKGNILPIDIDKKLKKQKGEDNKEDKGDKNNIIDSNEDIKETEQGEVDDKKSETMSEDYEKNSDV